MLVGEMVVEYMDDLRGCETERAAEGHHGEHEFIGRVSSPGTQRPAPVSRQVNPPPSPPSTGRQRPVVQWWESRSERLERISLLRPCCDTGAHARCGRLLAFSCELDVDDQHVEGVGPKVVRSPPGHLVKQVGVDASFEDSGQMQGVPELAVLRPRSSTSGRNRLSAPSTASGCCLVAPVSSSASRSLPDAMAASVS